VSIGPEGDTATRLVKTPTIETSLKLVAMIGVVEIWAARETVRRFESSSSGFLNRGAYRYELGRWRMPFSESPPELPAYKSPKGEKREIAKLAHAARIAPAWRVVIYSANMSTG
jgi:hypothetical protein